MVDKLDESVGIIVKELGMRKLLNNSIVIFASDNGGAPEGNRITFYILKKILKTIAYLYQNVHTSHLHKHKLAIKYFRSTDRNPQVRRFFSTTFHDNKCASEC